MIFYYQRAGTVAALLFSFYYSFYSCVLAGFEATLTMPGIAGIVLTIGMAVDANVLIYERIREEMATGKTIKASIDSGFQMHFQLFSIQILLLYYRYYSLSVWYWSGSRICINT